MATDEEAFLKTHVQKTRGTICRNTDVDKVTRKARNSILLLEGVLIRKWAFIYFKIFLLNGTKFSALKFNSVINSLLENEGSIICDYF